MIYMLLVIAICTRYVRVYVYRGISLRDVKRKAIGAKAIGAASALTRSITQPLAPWPMANSNRMNVVQE